MSELNALILDYTLSEILLSLGRLGCEGSFRREIYECVYEVLKGDAEVFPYLDTRSRIVMY